jgi:hypothetical protein
MKGLTMKVDWYWLVATYMLGTIAGRVYERRATEQAGSRGPHAWRNSVNAVFKGVGKD